MERLKELRQHRQLYQKDVASFLGIDRTTYVKWETGASEPDHATLLKLADFFGVSVDYLLGKSTENNKKIIPVYGNVAAGIPIEAITDIEDYEEIDSVMAAGGEYIALRIHGESMEPKMSDGDVVIVRLQPDVESGDTAIVLVNGNDATCKKIKKTPDGVLLISTNPAFDPMFYSSRQVADLPVRVLGKVVELRAKF